MASFVRLAVVAGSAVLGLPMFGGCASADAPNPAGGVAERETTPEPGHDARLAWAVVLDVKPDAAVVTDASWRSRIEATGYPWRVRHQASGVEMLLVPPGEYTRGASPGDSEAYHDEEPAHEVTITKAFYFGRYEVTQGEWTKVMGSNPSGNHAGDRLPVEMVSWDDIRGSAGFLERAGGGLRLPTDAEWEYACRAGTTGARYCGDEEGLLECGWFFRNSGSRVLPASTKWDSEKVEGEWGRSSRPVGGMRGNALGLQDMLGNVWEWCEDRYGAEEYYEACRSGVTDPKGPASGDSYGMRGGSWYFHAGFCRASCRNLSGGPALRNGYIGVRVARTLDFTLPISPPSSSDRPAPAPDGAAPVGSNPTTAGGVAERETTPEPGHDARLAWAEVLDVKPDAAVVADASWRSRIEATGYPWRVRHKASGIEMLLVPPGEYTRGASPGDVQARDVEKPAHSVTLTKAFYLGRYEVTRGEWSRVMGSNSPSNQEGDRYPVDGVSWDDICGSGGFLERAGSGLRLPTEAEWEYACRAGTTGARYGELGEIAWYSENTGLDTHAVGGKRANALGLHDMLGNVSEWCSDWFSVGEYSRCASGVTDPQGPGSGEFRVVRGHSRRCYDWACRASNSDGRTPADLDDDLGFRVARTL